MYYTKDDAHICAQLKRLNQAVYEGFITPAEATARARLLDPDLRVCPVCGEWPCDCTVKIPVSQILEAMSHEQ